MPVALGGAFHARRLTLQVVAGRHASRRRSARDGTRGGGWQLALALLRDPVLDALITGESDFEICPR